MSEQTQDLFSSIPASALSPSHTRSLTNTLLASRPSPSQNQSQGQIQTQGASFQEATRHPFLRLAGLGTLPKATLSRWLSQDRLYAQSYIGFIGALLARVDLPHADVYDKDKPSSLRWQIVDLLCSALENIRTELGFFAETARKYGLQLDAPDGDGSADGGAGSVFTPAPATKLYMELFGAFGKDPSKSLLDGLVVLWATEMCYLSAWTYAGSFGQARHRSLAGGEGQGQGRDRETSPHAADLDGGALRDAFIPNWTSAAFAKFVREIAEVTDRLAEREGVVGRDGSGDKERAVGFYQALWGRVLDIEKEFWPDVSAEGN